MQASFSILGSYPKTFMGLLWSCTTRHWSPAFKFQLLQDHCEHWIRLFVNWYRCSNFFKATSFESSLNDPTSQSGSLHFAPDAWWVTKGFSLFLPHAASLGVLLSFLWHWPAPDDSSFCNSWPSGKLDALFLPQLSELHLLLCCHRIPDCLRVLFAFYFPHKARHFRPHWLTSSFCNMEGLHRRAFLHDHLTQIGHCCIKIWAILFWLAPNNIDCSLQLNALDAMKQVVNLSAVVYSTVAL